MDQIIGDPINFPHPIRLIGSLIHLLDERLIREDDSDRAKFNKGILLCVVVMVSTVVVTGSVLFTAYKIHPVPGIAVEAVLICYILAAKSLQTESMKVYRALKEDDLEKARSAVSMIVGRDTEFLDEQGIIKATVETVAENTSDGVIAPMIYTFLGGPIAGFAYKAINTMDSMVGYHNERYEYFGRVAARLDDLVNFVPARSSALLMILSAWLLGRCNSATDAKHDAKHKDYSAGEALRIFLRDRYNHKSPNSAQTEAACAGALRVRLAGDAYYFGKLVKKPFIGDDIRPIEAEDIKRVCLLMRTTAYLCLAFLCVAGFFVLRYR